MQGHEQFALFCPDRWDLQGTLNNLKYGGVLCVFSSISVVTGSIFIPGPSEYDFTPFRNQWRRWKDPVTKLKQNWELTYQEHNDVVNSTNEMKVSLTMLGYVQPISRITGENLRSHLDRFQIWYERETAVIYSNAKGFNDEIRPIVETILHVC